MNKIIEVQTTEQLILKSLHNSINCGKAMIEIIGKSQYYEGYIAGITEAIKTIEYLCKESIERELF